jgi:glycosyltransferase involved in cell wall biosynthesis
MTSNKRVLILGKLPPPYMGPAIATDIILRSALKDHFTLFHLNTKINDSLVEFGKWGFGKMGKNISICFKMFKMCRRNKPDLVLIPISQTTMGFIKDSVFILIAKLCGRKVLVQLRGSNFNNWISSASPLMRSYVKSILKKTRAVIVLGNNLKYLFEEYYSSGKIFVVPNGANYNIPANENVSGEIKIIYLSNLLVSKGIEDVFEAIKILRENISAENITCSFSVDLIGEWYQEDTKKYCLSLKEKHKLPVNIHTSEESKNKLKYLSRADIFLFPPRDPEGHPWAIIEAMAAGLPIISTDRGAITESVIDGVNGYIVEVKSPEIIAQKLRILISEKDLREKMGKESRNLYLKNFTEEKMVENLTTVFDAVITEK